MNLAGCATNISPDVAQASSANSVRTSVPGVIVSEYVVTVKEKNVIGTVSGAALGGIAASTVGGNDKVHLASGIAGALIGGAAGNAIEDKMTTQKGIEYVIRLDPKECGTTTINRTGSYASNTTLSGNSSKNRYVNVIQGQGQRVLSVGDHVMVNGVGTKSTNIVE